MRRDGRRDAAAPTAKLPQRFLFHAMAHGPGDETEGWRRSAPPSVVDRRRPRARLSPPLLDSKTEPDPPCAQIPPTRGLARVGRVDEVIVPWLDYPRARGRVS